MIKNKMREAIEIKLDEIADYLVRYIDRDKTVEEYPSLYNGNMGIALFFAYYSKYRKSNNSEIVFEKIIDRCLEAISKGYYIHTFCSGLGGILYGIEFLNNRQFTDIDIEEASDDYMTFLETRMLSDMDNGYYDFMHGAIGVALYFLKRGGEKNHQACIKLIDLLELSAIKNSDTMKWASKNLKNEDEFNIAMSHGMSSIAIFLARMVKVGLDKERCSEMLRQTINYILQQEYDRNQIGSYFPHYSIESDNGKKYKSRLAWCYGDLGIATAIWQAGCILNNETWKNKAFEVFEFSATRMSLAEGCVVDAGICHGTAGIAQIFLRMYLETGNEKFMRANFFWINETLKMAKWEDGLAGYKRLSGVKEEKEWDTDYTFLEGIAGIGLALLSYLNKDNKSYSDWDEILLISNT